jgi:ABC-type microcin C transport system permease subunit YejE
MQENTTLGVIEIAARALNEIWGVIPRLILFIILSGFLSRQGDFSEWQPLLMLFVIMNLTSWMGMAAQQRAQLAAHHPAVVGHYGCRKTITA